MATWNTYILQTWSVLLYSVEILRKFLSFGYHFSSLFFFYINLPKKSYNLSRITFLLWSVFFIYFRISIIGEIINLIVLAAIITTEKIDNYRYNNFLVEEKKIFTTIIINSVEKIVIEIWHQRYHWWCHHMIIELTYVNIIFYILIYYR